MQLYSVEQQRSQALEAHAAVFGTLKVRARFAGQCATNALAGSAAAAPRFCLSACAALHGLGMAAATAFSACSLSPA
jgi:hypothetical protein